MTTEADFRDWVRGRWLGWVDGREPRAAGSRSGWGSGNGAPDTELGIPLKLPSYNPSVPLPVELKLANITHGTKLVAVNGVRESQRAWHIKAYVKGVTTAFMWGMPAGSDGWRAFIMEPNTGWCSLSEATELPGEERAFFRAVGDWARARWRL